ncbi:MAG TPA: hypothetical protein VGV87_27040 [Blastocatellia bacterium]|nr:hypothetical protein [Blastocatellia bacterium]
MNLTAHLLSKEEFERQKAYVGFECLRIKYMSDGLKVVGFIWKPKNTEGKKLPLIIVNHGGNSETGKLTPGRCSAVTATSQVDLWSSAHSTVVLMEAKGTRSLVALTFTTS